MKYVAFIPLRGGSKSVPRKNVKPIAGKPLCLWAIEAASGATRIDRVYVATDDPEIRRVVEAARLPRVEVVDRDPSTATDTASTESAMLEFCGKVEFESIVLIQATSPLLTSEELDAAIGRFEELGADSLVTVVAQKRFIWQVDAEGWGAPQNYEPACRPRRQDFDPYYVENGAFYVSRRAGLLATGSRLFGRVAAFPMAEETFTELDEPADWTILAAFLEQRRQGGGDLAARAKQLRMVLSDVDGVLTDSGMYYSNSGDELKKFNTRDGKGFELLRLAGLEVGIITAEDTALVARRAEKLKLTHLVQGSRDKVRDLLLLLDRTGLRPEQVAYIGDDLGDVGILGRVGLAACPADATPEARAMAHYVCERAGGDGAVRELAELILALRAQH
jgi:N-acylneuraminate cytidylyltransferase